MGTGKTLKGKGPGRAKARKPAEVQVDAEDLKQQWQLLKTAQPGFIETEGREKTLAIKQEELVKHVGVQTAMKRFDLKLEGDHPYVLDYTANGRFMLIGGAQGHVAAFDWQSGAMRCELRLDELVRDVSWLHDETLFAVAQKKYVFVYDHAGTEVHRLKKHVGVSKMAFLPYHFMLATVGSEGFLRYQDTSTGQLVAEWPTKLGKCLDMRRNPRSAVLHLAHAAGTVSLWSPNVNGPLVKMLCHKGPVQSVCIDPSGNYMVSAGLDGATKVWDLRTYRLLHRYYTALPVTTLDISQRGVLAAGFGAHVTTWQKAFKTQREAPYLTHMVPSHTISRLRFCPYEDILGLGYTGGLGSILIPGAGEASYDSFEADPFATRKQRQEKEVKRLLDKLQPETIGLDPEFVGNFAPTASESIAAEKETERTANPGQEIKVRKKARGRSSALRRYLRKHRNVIDERKLEQDALTVRKAAHVAEDDTLDALSRFKSKSLYTK